MGNNKDISIFRLKNQYFSDEKIALSIALVLIIFMGHKSYWFFCLFVFFFLGKPMSLTSETEEVATFYGKMLEHDYVTKDIFNKNFFKDWRKVGICVCVGACVRTCVHAYISYSS